MHVSDGVLIFKRRCSPSDILIGVIAATVLWVVLTAIGCNVAETTEAQLMVTGVLIVAYVLIILQFVTLTSTAIHAIIIRPDHTIDFRYANPRFDRRIAVQDIITVYRPPIWESFFKVPRYQRVFQPGLTYIFHRNGYIALGQIHHFRNFRDLLRALVTINPNVVIQGISS